MSQTLLEQIAAATAGEYDVVGALGETARGAAFLAREVASGHLVVLFVAADADELAVLAALGDEVPANGGRCTACGQAPPVWTAECPSCHRAFVLASVGAHRFSVDEVQAATAHAYDVEGEVAHQAGGSLFFVRDLADGRLVALAAQVDASGEQVLEAVWDAAGGRPRAVTPGVGETTSFANGAASAPFPIGAAPGYAVAGDPTDASGQEFASTGADPAPPARRRRWIPLAVAGALVAAGGGAWALMRRPAAVTDGPVVTPVDRTPSTAVTSLPPVPPTGTASDTATPHEAATGAPAARLARDSARDSDSARVAAAHADSAAAARRAPAFVQLDGALPNGWTWRVNNRPGPPATSVKLRLNRPAFLQVEAPGYCPDTLRVASPPPGSVQHWAPRLRGKPMVGEC